MTPPPARRDEPGGSPWFFANEWLLAVFSFLTTLPIPEENQTCCRSLQHWWCWCWRWPAWSEQAKPGVEPREAIRQLRARLAQPIDQPLEITPGTPLREAVALLSNRHKVPIYIDKQIFKLTIEDDIEARAVKLAPLRGISLGRALRLLLSEAGATYRVQPGYVEVTSPDRLRPNLWDERSFEELIQIYSRETLAELPPRVDAHFDQVALHDALAELADLSGVNVVLDARVAQQAPAVSAQFVDVPLHNAVKVLADMAGLTYVVEGNVLYVTSRENARALQKERERYRQVPFIGP
jgi:CBS domain-containing protein